ncbi:MAG: hypothetical protein CSA26_04395 [Desulfobacterales bacterium]|nr:MAG: hypothetical protein CSA26_04395 [Desulfobacterales bacterium]
MQTFNYPDIPEPAELTILLVNSSQSDPIVNRQRLVDGGYRLIECTDTVDFSSMAAEPKFDIIIVEPPEENVAGFCSDYRFPDKTPLLWAGPEQPELMSSETRPEMVIFCSNKPDTQEITSHLKSLQSFAAIHRSIRNQEQHIANLEQKIEILQKSTEEHILYLDILAMRDGLTGLFDRKHLNKVLPQKFSEASVNNKELSAILIDLDYFYEINKAAGTIYGDFVLNDFAARLTTIISQERGSCFRFSGETFFVLLPGTNTKQALDLAETLKNNLENKPFSKNNANRHVTFSAGIVSLIEHNPDDPDELIAMAEKALFTAKSEGRNRSIIYQPLAFEPGTMPTLVSLKENLTKILDKTRSSAIDSLQLLAKDIAGENNQHHIKNVREYTELLGNYMRLPPPIIQTFKNAITLHTSIRFLLHNELINKKELFSEDERELMNDFPCKLIEITEMFEYFAHERAVLLHHSERFDGTGYPEGLQGEEIPLGARIFNIVDALAAMNSDRPHRPRLKPEKIIEELTKGAGTQFDPELVVNVLELIGNKQILDVEKDRLDKSINQIQKSFSHLFS